MDKFTIAQNLEDAELLIKFNERNSVAFGQIYYCLYDEILYFTSKLYRDTEIVASDVMHDLYSNIWVNRKLTFDNINSLRSYMYVSIRNGFRNYLKHKNYIDKYSHTVTYEDDEFEVDIAESYIFSLIDDAMSVLPQDCAKVIKYYLDGWQIKDIAEKLNKSERTVYNRREQAIEILRKKLSKDKLYILLPLFYDSFG